MIRFYKTPAVVKWQYPSFIFEIPSADTIYLTFDDGPNPEVTPWILDQLKSYKARATFFCLGNNLLKYPHLMMDILNEGHSIGNHTMNHLHGWNTSDKEYEEDVNDFDQIYAANLFRPPYGRMKKSQANMLSDKKIIMWSHMGWDFDPDLNQKKALAILKSAKPGSIILLHNSLKSFQNLKILLPELLKHYSERGLKLEAIR